MERGREHGVGGRDKQINLQGRSIAVINYIRDLIFYFITLCERGGKGGTVSDAEIKKQSGVRSMETYDSRQPNRALIPERGFSGLGVTPLSALTHLNIHHVHKLFMRRVTPLTGRSAHMKRN